MITQFNYNMSLSKNSISLLIPAYLRGTLCDEQKARLENIAKDNASVAAEIEFQKRLIDSLKENEIDNSFNKAGWSRLAKAIKKEPK